MSFVSSTDLHLAGTSVIDADLFGIAAGSITTDFDNDLRSTVHLFKGANEGYYNSWNGSQSANWTDVLNWTRSPVPTATENIIIDDVTSTMVITTGISAICNKLFISDNANVDI